jgi:hypothetical protein
MLNVGSRERAECGRARVRAVERPHRGKKLKLQR